MLRRLGIRGKVLAALSVPVLVLSLLAGLISLQAIQDAQVARTTERGLEAFQRFAEVTTALQAERRAAVPFVAADPSVRESLRSELGSSRSTTDAALSAFNLAVRQVNLESVDPAISSTIARFSRDALVLDSIRRSVDAASLPYNTVARDYGSFIETTIALTRTVAEGLTDRRVAALVTTNATLAGVAENLHLEQVLGAQMLSGDRPLREVQAVTALFAPNDIARSRAAGVIVGAEVPGALLPALGTVGEGIQTYAALRQLVATEQNIYFERISAEDWTRFAVMEIEALQPTAQAVAAASTERAADMAQDSVRSAVITVLATILAVVFSVAVALTIARQITEPLRRLTVAAGRVRDDLPSLVDQVSVPGQGPDLRLAQIPVTSHDEIGQLATAFNEVNTTTIQVAQEQAALRGSIAEMFVNVARRDQILLNRQLSFIDALERSEEDPATLADLFRLDHLATRMRRNAESLLVLAGIDTGRRLRDAMPVSDVIRTASSEIEHYERIQLDLRVDPLMLGHTALAAAHLLAEILENATVFSEPGTPVQVSTGIDENHVLVTVLDQGLGMAPIELEQANVKIRSTSASDVLGAQRLGLFVVGRIANRLGAQVELSQGPGGMGTLAVLRLPLALFVEPDKIPLTQPMQPARIESFALPEEAAEVIHDTAYAPAPAFVEDVASGQLGSAANPAEQVDLAALTDGATPLGLPRRRSRSADVDAPAPSASHRDEDDAAAAPSIPTAPSAESLAGAAGVDLESWSPPMVGPSGPKSLPTRRAAAPPEAAAPAADLPTRRPAGPALPTRQPTPGTQTGALPVRQQTGSSVGQQSPSPAGAAAGNDSRAALFSGFRSRRAELAAASVGNDRAEPVDPTIGLGGPDGAERLAAAAAGAAAFFGRAAVAQPAAQEQEPSSAVQQDEEQPAGAWGGTPDHGAPVSARHAAAHVAEQPETPAMFIPKMVEDDDDYYAPLGQPGAAGPDVAPSEASPWYETSADELPQDSTALWSPSAFVPGTPLSGAPAEVEQPAYQQPAYEQPAYQQPAYEQPAYQQPASEQPAYEQPAYEQPAYEQPVYEQPAAQWREEAPAAWQAPAPTETRWEAPAAAPWQADAAQPAAVAETAPWQAQVPAQVPEPAPWQVAQQQAPEQSVGTPAFAELVQGPTRRSTREVKRRRGFLGLFGRNGPAEVTAAPASSLPAPVQTPAFAPVAPVQPPTSEPSFAVPAPLGQPTVSPVRTSAWNVSEETGSHTYAPVDEPRASAPSVATPAGGGWQPPPTAVAPAPPQWSAPPAATPPAAVAPAPAAPAPMPDRPWVGHETTGAGGAPSGPLAPQPSLPARTGAATTFTPQPTLGAFDDEVTNMLAQRGDIAQQALSELSQLSSYRPQTVSGAAPASLTRRVPGNIPAAPEIKVSASGSRPDRDANQVRSLLSSFQTGTSRGRRAAEGTEDPAGALRTTGGTEVTGHEDGSAGGYGEPVTTPDTDLTQRNTSW